MKPFTKLTYRGQVRRLREMALIALQHYDLQVEDISLLQHLYNTLFRVDCATGIYVIRINAPGQREEAEIRSEMMWLEALRRDTDLQVPTPLLPCDGDYLVTTTAEGIPEARHCVVFEWVPGRQFRRHPTPNMIRRMGRCLAKLHNHAETWQPPDNFWLKKLDKLEQPAFWESLDPILFPPQRIAIFQEATRRAQSALDNLYADEANRRVIHADLHPGNVKLHEGILQIFDFDDCSWGYLAQDMAISLYYLSYYPNASELQEAFIEGYTSLRPAPRRPLEMLMVARELLVMAFIARSDNLHLQERAPAMLSEAESRLRKWLEV